MNHSQKQAIEAKAEELYPKNDTHPIYDGIYNAFVKGATFGLSLSEIEVNAVKKHNEQLVSELKRVLSKNEWVSVKTRLPTKEDADVEKYIEAWDSESGCTTTFRYEQIKTTDYLTHWRRIVKPVTPPNK